MKTAVNVIVCSITLSLILLFFYLRFNREKPRIDLNVNTIQEYYDYLFVLFFISLILFIILLFSYIFKQLLHKTKPKESSYILKFVFWYHKYNIFYNTYTIIFDYLSPNYTQYLITLTKHFLSLSDKKQLFLVFVCVVLPRSLIIIILLLEIYNQRLHYYFYFLLLLLIPLIFKFVIFILKDIGPRLVPELNKLLAWDHSNDTVYTLNTAQGEKKTKAIGIRFKPEYTDRDLDHFLYNYYYPLLYIEGEMTVNFIPKYSKITLVVLLSYLGIHICGWGYLLFFVAF